MGYFVIPPDAEAAARALELGDVMQPLTSGSFAIAAADVPRTAEVLKFLRDRKIKEQELHPAAFAWPVEP